MSNTNYPIFKANIILKGKIECLTGLHIGGSKEKLEIGGVDSPVLRNPQTSYPYIPGSSLKGKLRSLLEFSIPSALLINGGKLGDVSQHEQIVRLFGIGADEKDKAKEKDSLYKVGTTRLIIRDCNPDETTIKMWKNMDSELLYTEYKPENTIDRLTSAANPRFIERVVAGSFFNFEIIYGVYEMSENETDKIKEDLKNLLTALRLLENNFLGKSGTRGYGQVKFHLEEPLTIKVEDYQDTEKYKKVSEKIGTNLKSLSEISLSYGE